MMPFDHLFPEIAARETLALKGALGTLVFHELYCDEPGCDCRQVVLVVVSGERVVASIAHAFERPRRREQTFLDSMGAQSELSQTVLEAFVQVKTPEIEARLQRHYRMWKDVVDDPSHPEHARVRGPGRAPRAKRKAKAAKAPPRATDIELVVAKAAGGESKLQRRFRSLMQKVDRLRQRLQEWRQRRADVASELAAYTTLFERRCTVDRELVALLDRSYSNKLLSKVDRKRLATRIADLAGELIAHGGHDDLKPLYARYNKSDFDAEAEQHEAIEATVLRSVLEEAGLDFGDADVSSVEKIQEFARAQLDAAEARKTKRKKSAKQLAAEARRAEDKQNATRAVQEVYRMLARSLHPDREQDAEARARKTAMMTEVNVAYEAGDLLRLLELQLELERVEPTEIDALAEARLRHYNHILDEQAKQLAMELDEVELPFRLQMELPPDAKVSPVEVIAQIRVDTKLLSLEIDRRSAELAAFEDIKALKASLKRQALDERMYDAEADLFY